MENKKSFFRVLFTFVIFLLMTGQRALAVNGWNIQTSTSDNITTFTVTRTNKAMAETVKYRLVNLSAYAGQHYKVIQVNGNVISESQQSAALSGEFTFAAGDDTRTIQVKEQGANTKAYMYQTGSNRSYKLEVTDAGGFLLFDKTRSFATGKDVNISRAFQEQSVTICSNEVTVTDAGYAQSSNPHTVASSSYFDENTQAYLGFLNAQLRMTLDFQAKEKSDGYQYVQILVNNTSDCDTGAGSGDPGTISLSRYMAGFDIGGSAVNTYYSYSFPVTSAGNNEGASKPWAGIGNSVTDLKKQKFNTGCRATDGKLIIPTNFSTLVVRLNASGSDNDDWYVKNIKAKITAVDEAAPYKLNISVAPGMHAHGNTVYVSVAFNEIVTVSGTPKLITTTDNNWGNLSYVTGSGSNVLTFSGKIGDNATGTLNITGFDGTITDLAGNPLSRNALNQSGLCSLSNSYNYPITYDLAGGSVATQNPSSYTYDTNSFTLTNPTRLGYTFAGWTGTDLDAATQNVSIDQHTHVSRNYTANWTINTYNITLDYAMGGVEPFSLQYTVESGTIKINGHYRKGYLFAGWTGDSLDGATMTVIIPTGSVGDRNYIAHWIDVWGMEDGATGYEDHPYIITSTQGLDLLAESIIIGDEYEDVYFQLGCDITYSYTTNWNDASSNENNFTPIGGNNRNKYFRGIFDGMGHTISGIRIYNGDSNNSKLGLFGATSGATIRNVILADARITGKIDVGGIVGYNKDGVVENCRVDSNVAIHSVVDNSICHGGVVGRCSSAAIRSCVSSANLTVADGLRSINFYGGIVGVFNGDMTDCLALGVSVPAVGTDGAISGNVTVSAGNQTDNYFYDCTVGANAHQSDAYTVSAGTDVTVAPADSADQSYPYDGVKRYGAALYYDGVLYAPAAADVSLALGFTGTPEIGYTLNEYVTNAGTISGTDSPYILSMPSQDVTVGATTIDVWDVEKGNDGSTADKAYTITTTAGLNLMAKLVSDGNNFSGKFFKLGNDIDMNGVVFDGIGSSYYYFMGSFDGDGHTISNVTIDRSNGIYDVGFFGNITYGTVKNLIIDGASITGNNYVGGIIGYSYQTTVSNCLVLNTSITVTNGNYCGVYGYSGGSLTATNNYYNNCTVTIGETTYTTNIGVSSNDLDGVRSVYTLTLPEHITASSSDTVTIGTTTYYASDVQVTLSHDQGYKITDVKVDDIPATSSDEGFNWIVTMPAVDATVTCGYSVPYIDADGVEQYCTNYTLVQNSDTCVHYGSYAKENWYVVDGDVFISDPSNYAIFLKDSISHIIICDDATLVAIGNGYWGEAICNLPGEIRIYGQTLGNGFIYAIGNDGSSAVLAYEGININGGNIFAQGNNYGIYSEKNITINRGTVKASGIKGDTVTINGGKVHTIDYNYGICGERYISLGWKSVDDRIFANNYITTLQNSSVIIKDTQAFADSLGNCYTGTLNQQDQLAIAGRTLQPCCIIALPEHVVATGVISQDGITAYALPGSVITLSARVGCKMSGVAVAGVTATDNGDETYTFTMPAQKVTVSATVTDFWGIGAGKDGSTADKAYTITTTAGLDLLATLVNDGNDYNGKYFKLGGNIEYDSSIENNYTAIGTDSNPFEGIFDGNGYTVSGINIQSNESYQGLFGMIIIGEVRNLTVKGADIRGNNNVGAIAGKCEGSLENCLVIETTVSGNNDVDMICGGYGHWSLYLANCHYINCRHHNWSPGYYSTDLYTVNAGNDVLMSINSYDKGFEYNGVLYFPTEAEVILDLSYTGQVPDGDVPIFVTTEGILSKTANSYLLVVSDNETINALIGKPDINYIDSIGVAQVCPAAVPITSHEGDLEYEYGGWYVVNGQVTVNGMISFEEDAHIILCDGATLTADAIISEYDGISIYAQSSGDDMGCINSGIYVSEELTINGGKITTKKSDIEEFKGIGLFSHDIVMYSGIINTMGDSIVCDYLVLGWRNTTDCVTAGGYRCDYFEIYPGQVLTDGNYLYYGLMNLTQIDEMSGKTLMPYQTYAVTESDGITDAIAADIAGEMVSFGRNYIEDIATTICLPFSISDVSVGEIYKFVDVSYSNRDGWVATMEEIERDYDGFLVTATEAGKPYLFIPYLTGTWSFVGRVPDDVSSVAGATASGDWTFHGTYSRMNYGDEGFSGTVFGFAATDGKAADGVTDVEAGQFVKAASGAYILPFRAYLTYSGSNNALRAPGRDGTETPAIPSRIKVRLVRSNGITTAIGTMDRETGEVTIDQWFYLNGQPVEGTPAVPGMYLNADGKKVMITE